jgi:hypothetical protein
MPEMLSTNQRLNISDLADPALLKAVWRGSLRRRLRTTRLRDTELARDPLDLLGFERNLGSILDELCLQLKGGTYRPSPPEVIRAGKRVGLTRPLAFLGIRDLLILKALVGLAENDLIRSGAAYARLGRAQAGDDDTTESLSESSWFMAWLRRDGQIWIMTSEHEWLVESDIANFFPSIHIGDVCSFVLDNSRLGVRLVRLLEYVLQTYSPVSAYHPSRVGGLPQDGFDISRVLAHQFLKPIDDDFFVEGSSDRYSRYVDDIVMGADTWDEALKLVNRLQIAMEAAGLYPNSGKTRIIRRAEFRVDYMKLENDYLGEVSDEFEAVGTVDMARFRARLHKHLTRADRPKAWVRVLRRYYGLSRRLDDPTLLRWWPTHLEDTPDSARHIFDYLACRPMTLPRFYRLTEVLDHFGGAYEDLEILAQEFLCQVPCPNTTELRERIADWALEKMRKEASQNPRLAAAACLTVGKFGLTKHIDELELEFKRHMPGDTVLRMQASIVLFDAARLTTADLQRLLVRSRDDSVDNLEFLIALGEGSRDAVGMAFSALDPVEKREPNRWVVRSRMIFLAPILRSVAARQVAIVAPRWQRLLKSNHPRLRDSAALRSLS